jgi:hypothetical protein
MMLLEIPVCEGCREEPRALTTVVVSTDKQAKNEEKEILEHASFPCASDSSKTRVGNGTS